MRKGSPAGRRERVERNIYKRVNAAGRDVFEVGYRDSTGAQRWRTVDGGIMAARAVRDDLLGRKARHERVQPNPRLRFGEAADRWLAGPVSTLRSTTQAGYRSAVEVHLRPRWGRRRLDAITADDVAQLVRDLRTAGRAEWTISVVVKVAGQVFRYATTRLGWHAVSPTSLLSNGERPKVGSTARRRIYRGEELQQTLAAAREPYRTLFALATVTGARQSELLGLVWDDVRLDDLDAAEVRFVFQVDRQGRRQELKTEESQRTVEIPRQLAAMLTRHKLSSIDTGPTSFVFATRSGRPLGQRNCMRALRLAQSRAIDEKGRPTFPVLAEVDERGRPVRPQRGSVPSFHGFRHSAASEAISAGESAEEISWQLGHKSSVVTRSVYVQEIKTAERTARRRAKMEARYGSALEALDDSSGQQQAGGQGGEVRQLRGNDGRAK